MPVALESISGFRKHSHAQNVRALGRERKHEASSILATGEKVVDEDVTIRETRVTILVVEEKKPSASPSHTSWTCTKEQYARGEADRVKIMKMLRRQLERACVQSAFGLQWVGRAWFIYYMRPVTQDWAWMEVVDQGCVTSFRVWPRLSRQLLTRSRSVLAPSDAHSVIECFAAMLVLRSKLVALQNDVSGLPLSSPMARGVQPTPAKSREEGGKPRNGATGATGGGKGDGGPGVAARGAGGGRQKLSDAEQYAAATAASVWPMNMGGVLRALPQTSCPVVSNLATLHGRYHSLEHLTTTPSADVCTATCADTGAHVVLKRLNCSADAALKQVVMAGLTNRVEGIAPLLDVVRDGAEGRIVLCYLLLRPLPATMPLKDIQRHAVTVLRTLVRLHDCGVAHMDIKPDHVLLGAQDEAILIDTGIACTLPRGGESRCLPAVGTHGYAAPEVESATARDGRCDVFSFGRTLERWMARRETGDGEDGPLLAQLEGCLPGMLAEEPFERCTAAEALAALTHQSATVGAVRSKSFSHSDGALGHQRRPLSEVNT